MSTLAINGGEKAKAVPYGTGKRFGNAELQQLKEALDQETLFYWHGTKVKALTEKFAKMYGVPYCVATTSGTASVHVALGVAGVTAGNEVITSPVTDMGSAIGILFQNAIPIFADIDPHTYNIDPKSIEAKITDKTKAILIVHLAGNPADMDPIMEIARKHNITVIEDCAQSFMCYYKGRLAGTIGDIGCFSTNDYKHISSGDGGMVLVKTRKDYEKAFGFADKNYLRLPDSKHTVREIQFLAPNYRMSELQGAVALAQLDKLEWICKQRNWYGDTLTAGIQGLPGIYTHKITEGGKSSYWFYLLRINEKEAKVSRVEFTEALAAEGINASIYYMHNCVYEYDLFKNRNAYEGTDCPFGCKLYGKEIKYGKGMCPVAEEVLDSAIHLEVKEFFTEQDVQDTIKGIRKVADYFRNR